MAHNWAKLALFMGPFVMGPFFLWGSFDPRGNPKRPSRNPKRPLSIWFWPLSWADSALKLGSLWPKNLGQNGPKNLDQNGPRNNFRFVLTKTTPFLGPKRLFSFYCVRFSISFLSVRIFKFSYENLSSTCVQCTHLSNASVTAEQNKWHYSNGFIFTARWPCDVHICQEARQLGNSSDAAIHSGHFLQGVVVNSTSVANSNYVYTRSLWMKSRKFTQVIQTIGGHSQQQLCTLFCSLN